MESAAKFYVSNHYARIILRGYEEVLGRERLSRMLQRAHLDSWLAGFPPENLAREVSFASCSALGTVLEEMYGLRGGCGLSVRAGRAAFTELLQTFDTQLGVDRLSFRLLPLREKLGAGLYAIADLLEKISDQPAVVTQQGDRFFFTVQRCASCWGREQLERPICCLMTGILQESVKWLSGGQDWCIVETRCLARGDAVCEFEIPRAVA